MRLLHQQHADLKKLLLSVGEQARPAMTLGTEAEQAQHLVDPVFLLAVQPGAQAGPHGFIPFHRQLKVFPHRQSFKHRRLLKLATDTLTGNGDRIEGGEIR